MDPTVLQLFTQEEILERLAQKRRTGALHIFTAREAANLFFKDGILVAAARGLVEGEDVLKQAMDWKEVGYIWIPDLPASAHTLKSIHIRIPEFLAKLRMNSLPVAPIHLTAADKAATTMPVSKMAPRPVLNPTAPVQLPPVAPATAPAELAATGALTSTGKVRTAQEEALLNKHRLELVALADGARLPITRVSSLIGRNPACDITLAHASISRQHCLLQITDRGLHVKDLGTTNGTKVNGIPLTEGYINAGDKLTIGHLVYELVKV